MLIGLIEFPQLNVEPWRQPPKGSGFREGAILATERAFLLGNAKRHAGCQAVAGATPDWHASLDGETHHRQPKGPAMADGFQVEEFDHSEFDEQIQRTCTIDLLWQDPALSLCPIVH